MALPRSFQNLVENLTILPGVGEKTAERYVYALYEKEDDDVEALAKALINFKKNIKTCAICGCLSDETKCEGIISLDEALSNADSPTNLSWLINNSEIPSAQASEDLRNETPLEFGETTSGGTSFKEFSLNLYDDEHAK